LETTVGADEMRFFAQLSKVQWAHLVLLSCQLSFSGWHLIGSVAMKYGADPFVFVLYRELFASLVMYALLRYNSIPVIVDPKDYTRFAVLGFCSFVNVVGAMLALKYVTASRFAIFQPSIPCIATVISIFLGMEQITILKCAGIMLAVGGAILSEAWDSNKGSESSSTDDEKSKSSNVIIGTTIVAAQVVAMACLVVFSKPILSRYSPSLVTFVYYSVGTVLTMVLFAGYAFQFSGEDLVFDSMLLPWLALMYAVAFPTVYNYNALSWCGKLLAPSITTVYMTFQPISTIILSFLILNQRISLSEGIGTVLVVLGLVATVYAQQYDSSNTKKDSMSSSISSSSFSSNHSGTHLLYAENSAVSSLHPEGHQHLLDHDHDHSGSIAHRDYAPVQDSEEANTEKLEVLTGEEDIVNRVNSMQSSGNSSTWSRQQQLVSVTIGSASDQIHSNQGVRLEASIGLLEEGDDSRRLLKSELLTPLSPMIHSLTSPLHRVGMGTNFGQHQGQPRSRQASGDTQSSGGLSSISSGRRSLTAAYSSTGY
jgi:drug/metabolite transporter (DMT)-like permease